ncbi:D-alanyl-D-alanine carboxypeptidase family protein [Secundilactobacillus similis]|uniref:S11 family D-Ala-D-Ala carboxypeptidase n=2 Tax=Secundilactobacillus similis TaxID=414682 RepID=A0A0R2F0P4_9LACO|nr:serine hydrolase [Secundilactobacillus similis]KRN21414.1 S11 family D-Ala-D-Ala carboxypeptidase [Secundilactobacillus similis DSM 23365 = JCM 2765]
MLIAISCAALVFTPTLTSYAKTKKDTKMSSYKKVKAAYVMDAKSGQTLYDDRGDKELPIASLSKMMTLYLTTQAIKQHQLKWSDKVSVNKQLIKMSKNYALGTFKINRSKQYTVKQLYQAALIASSNSAAIALGEAVTGGDNAKFIAKMNQQAKAWHLDANFISSSGLDNSDLHHYGYQIKGTTANQQNLVSAKAITVVAQHLVDAFPQITKWSSKATYDIGNQTLINANSMLKTGAFYRKSNHLDGLKTGYTEKAHLCLTITYWRHGRQLVATILGSDTTFSAMNGIITHLDKVLNYKTMTEKKQTYRVKHQTVKTTPTETKTGVWYLKNQDPAKISITNKLTTTTLPVKKGSLVTQTSFNHTGLPAATDLGQTATKTVTKPKKSSNTHNVSGINQFFNSIKDFFTHLF